MDEDGSEDDDTDDGMITGDDFDRFVSNDEDPFDDC